MKKILIISLLFISCSIKHDIIGNYYGSGKDYKKSLTLNKNGSFVLSLENFDNKSKCHGKSVLAFYPRPAKRPRLAKITKSLIEIQSQAERRALLF
jgi:hypothetical protein